MSAAGNFASISVVNLPSSGMQHAQMKGILSSIRDQRTNTGKETNS